MILELCWAQVAERGVESAGVVDLIDKAWKIGGDVFESFVIHQIDGLDLKGLHKALGLGIVIGIATSAHRADETMFGQQVAIGLGGVLSRSEWWMQPFGGRPIQIAAFSATTATRASIERLIA